jgi:hypothetical protein
MYTFNKLPVTPAQAGRLISLPLNVMLAIPPYLTPDSHAPVYNLVAGMNQFLGHDVEWDRKTMVLKPSIWAPSWSDEQLQQFVEPSFAEIGQTARENLAGELRSTEFLGATSAIGLEQLDQVAHEIVHFIGYVVMLAGDPVLDLGSEQIGAGTLRDKLVAGDTRLFILQVPIDQFATARWLAEIIAGSGGPAVLVVVGDSNPENSEDSQRHPRLLRIFGSDNWVKGDAESLRRFLSDLYLNIVHSYELPEIGQTQSSGLIEEWTAELFYGEGGEGLLQVLPWIDTLEERMLKARDVVGQNHVRLNTVLTSMSQMLHVSQRSALENVAFARQDELNDLSQRIDSNQFKLVDIRNGIRYHESRGALPLTEVAEDVAGIETFVKESWDPDVNEYRNFGDLRRGRESSKAVFEVEEAFETEVAKAPLVLNANFKDQTSSDCLPLRKGLRAGQPCTFLVDVGPVWDQCQSLVTGFKDFPIKSMPQDVSGWVIQVVLVSDDFTPTISSGMIYVSAAGGRSFPYQDGKRSPKKGPLSLFLQAPSLPEKNEGGPMTARARLCLYYENNLLQSAVVKVGVVHDPDTPLEEDNVVDVDYRLTGSFRQLERYSTRTIQLHSEEEARKLPVTLNLTLNDDGGGGHRLLIKKYGDLVPGLIPYNAVGTLELLASAREKLKECFYQRDALGKVPAGAANKEPDGLDPENGKTLQQFKLDLFVLADLGQKLYWTAFTQVAPEADDQTSLAWKQALKTALTQTAVIQVARTRGVPAEFVFPWGLIYDHDLSMDTSKWKYCKVIEKEWVNGRRKGSFDKPCPLSKTPGDHEDLLCPYGFWGIRHMVEQPITPLRKKDGQYLPFDTPDEIRVGDGPMQVAIGITRDKNLDAQAITTHLDHLKTNHDLQFVLPGEADDYEKVKNILPGAQMVYFLCHGELDTTLVPNEPYIGVGFRDNDPAHRVYPRDLSKWALSPNQPNLAKWPDQRPLVFINGCHTADLKPTQILNFVTTLADIQAGGVIGTEVSIRLPLATEVAELIFKRMLETKPDGELFSIGEAIQQMRWSLLNKGNLLGLAYTPYCLSSLRFATEH